MRVQPGPLGRARSASRASDVDDVVRGVSMEPRDAIGRLEELSREECLELLASHEVGRLAVVVEGQPVIFPVNYALDGDIVVFRNDPGTKLTHARLDKVAFEIDDVDGATREGWSVVVTGTARELTDALDEVSVREQNLPLRPWATGDKAHWVRIIAGAISGRRLHQVAPDPGTA